MKSVRRKISKRRRSAIGRKAALARWGVRAAEPAATSATTCQAEETGDGRVACIPCGLSWDMRDVNCPICPRIAGLKALPPIRGNLEARAQDIVRALVHGGHPEDFRAALANRPDWQAHVSLIVDEFVALCAEVGG